VFQSRRRFRDRRHRPGRLAERLWQGGPHFIARGSGREAERHAAGTSCDIRDPVEFAGHMTAVGQLGLY
jgi:hypothetical protein